MLDFCFKSSCRLVFIIYFFSKFGERFSSLTHQLRRFLRSCSPTEELEKNRLEAADSKKTRVQRTHEEQWFAQLLFLVLLRVVINSEANSHGKIRSCSFLSEDLLFHPDMPLSAKFLEPFFWWVLSPSQSQAHQKTKLRKDKAERQSRKNGLVLRTAGSYEDINSNMTS